ncbi:MAG: menaquinone biosynthetic enzyme MqnA/MqnD family protein [Longimicrobiales bacterium]
MIRLGHIVYSNCFPVHALLVDGEPPPEITLVRGVPSELNEQLANGDIDVAPCSSIEYARHQGEYGVLPGLAIASAGPVQSILVESRVPAEDLSGCDVMVPTASATSVVLLRILLEMRFGVAPKFRWFDQGAERDPLAGGAAAALWIGDVALGRPRLAGRVHWDLGESWTDWTGLPFVYAIWQARAGVPSDESSRLHGLLLDSLAYFSSQVDPLAARHGPHFGVEPARLSRYWRSLRYSLDPDSQRGLLHFFRLAAELGEAPPTTALRWIDVNGS